MFFARLTDGERLLSGGKEGVHQQVLPVFTQRLWAVLGRWPAGVAQKGTRRGDDGQ